MTIVKVYPVAIFLSSFLLSSFLDPGVAEIGLSVHHLLLLPGEEESELQAICEAALITKIRRKEEGVVSLYVFPEGSEIITVGNVAHSLALEDDTWHFISECQTDS